MKLSCLRKLLIIAPAETDTDIRITALSNEAAESRGELGARHVCPHTWDSFLELRLTGKSEGNRSFLNRETDAEMTE